MSKTWTLVLRNHKTGKTMIWENDTLNEVVRRMSDYYKDLVNHDWTREADRYLRMNYGRVEAKELASVCSKLLCRHVTKNAVIGRYNRIKALSPDDITYNPVPENTHIAKDPDSELNTPEGWKGATGARYGS